MEAEKRGMKSRKKLKKATVRRVASADEGGARRRMRERSCSAMATSQRAVSSLPKWVTAVPI